MRCSVRCCRAENRANKTGKDLQSTHYSTCRSAQSLIYQPPFGMQAKHPSNRHTPLSRRQSPRRGRPQPQSGGGRGKNNVHFHHHHHHHHHHGAFKTGSGWPDPGLLPGSGHVPDVQNDFRRAEVRVRAPQPVPAPFPVRGLRPGLRVQVRAVPSRKALRRRVARPLFSLQHHLLPAEQPAGPRAGQAQRAGVLLPLRSSLPLEAVLQPTPEILQQQQEQEEPASFVRTGSGAFRPEVFLGWGKQRSGACLCGYRCSGFVASH